MPSRMSDDPLKRLSRVSPPGPTRDHGDGTVELLLEILQSPPAERQSLLDERSGGDGEIRRKLDHLLALETKASGYLETAHASGSAARRGTSPSVLRRSSRPLDPEAPREIDGYRVLGLLGQGGMGVVYLAEQTEPVRREVALKLIKLGMDTREVIARFESERQALALMDHPNIARVYDAGCTTDGRPYFVMERVQGLALSQYCDRHKLSIRERILLLIQVCRAIEHAHRRGVIHRDIKPSNILVSTPDSAPVAKIIDFGVARAVNQRLTERTIHTELGRTVGTPAYMSPEQAELTSEGIDHRTDVYSLGIVLYELLVGEPPIEPEFIAKAALDEIIRRIREDEPPTPSTRCNRLNLQRTAELAHNRRTNRTRLRAELRGDLDWITMKALAKERERRYSTAAQLAEDLTRHLAGDPILAHPPQLSYTVGKFIRRHRGAVSAATGVLLALSVGLLGTTWFAVRAGAYAEDAATNLEAARSAELLARSRLDQVLRLADARRLLDHEQRAEALWPSLPEMIPDMESWISTAEKLASRLPTHVRTLNDIRSLALPYDDSLRQRDRESHPMAPELRRVQSHRRSLTRERAALEAETRSRTPPTVVWRRGVCQPHGPMTCYFRHVFELDRSLAAELERATLRITVDDGAVVYLNGKEVIRRNLPRGSLTHETRALSRAEDAQDPTQEIDIPYVLFKPGENVLAVEVHQWHRTSSDLALDLRLDAEGRVLIGPGAVWRYRAERQPPEEAWASSGFDDSAWPKGTSPLGYGFKGAFSRLQEIDDELREVEDRIAELQRQVTRRRTWEFESAEVQWEHDSLAALVAGLEKFLNPDPDIGTLSSVRRRVAVARSIYEKSVEDAETSWATAIASIADVEETPRYGGLRVIAQSGLVPLGRDPTSGLWEFAHIASGEVPERGTDDRLILRENSCLVFVLIPGGTFLMGATPFDFGVVLSKEDNLIADVLAGSPGEIMGLRVGDRLLTIDRVEIHGQVDLDRAAAAFRTGDRIVLELLRDGARRVLSGKVGPNVDPHAGAGERPVHQVTLAPFLLSKYEMTQGQWLRLTGRNPSFYSPERYPTVSLLHPVEQVSWNDCREVLRKWGMLLPTEAQWEYAARAGTTTIWETGNDPDSLSGRANLYGSEDGFSIHGPVGKFRPNGFGLHDIIGNVWEWCRDRYADYRVEVQAGDGERLGPSDSDPVDRGAAFDSDSGYARSARRDDESPVAVSPLGVRPSLRLRTRPPVSPARATR